MAESSRGGPSADESQEEQDISSFAGWKEPFGHISYLSLGEFSRPLDDPGYRRLCIRSYIVESLETEVLSERAVALIANLVDEGGSGWENDQVELTDGKKESLLDLSLMLLERSYGWACMGNIDQPQIALMIIDILHRIAHSLREKESIISKVASLFARLVNSSGGRAAEALARINLIAVHSDSPADIDALGDGSVLHQKFTHFVLKDLQTMVQRKFQSQARMIIHCILRHGDKFNESGEIEDSLELMYLMLEHMLRNRRYDFACQLPEMFTNPWNFSANDSQYDVSRRKIKCRLARAFEAKGDLSGAAQLYKDIGMERSVTIEQLLLLEKPFWSHESYFDMGVKCELVGAGQCGDGSKLVFVKTKCDESKGGSQFRLFSVCSRKQSKEVQEKDLPHSGRLWKYVKLVPGSANAPLHVLVAPKSEDGEEEGSFDDLISCFGGRLEALVRQNANQQALQLWEYDGLCWTEIVTRGNVPEGRLLASAGNACAKVSSKIVFFGGAQIGPMKNQSSNVFVLDIQKREWFNLPHPYLQEGGTRGAAMKMSPFLTHATTLELGGREFIGLLREGKCLVKDTSRGNEVIPKFALDIVEPFSDLSGKTAFAWRLNVQTRDRSGYIANIDHTKTVQVGDFLVAVAFGCISEMPTDENPLPRGGGTHERNTSVDLLDLRNMEWRGSSVHNDDLLKFNDEYLEIIANADSDSLLLVSMAGHELHVLRLHNASKLESSIRKALGSEKLTSRKKCLSYIIKKAKRHKTTPMRMCAFCGLFEDSVTGKFMICGRCLGPYYCGKECQRKHWKRDGGNHKMDCDHRYKTKRNLA